MISIRKSRGRMQSHFFCYFFGKAHFLLLFASVTNRSGISFFSLSSELLQGIFVPSPQPCPSGKGLPRTFPGPVLGGAERERATQHAEKGSPPFKLFRFWPTHLIAKVKSPAYIAPEHAHPLSYQSRYSPHLIYIFR